MSKGNATDRKFVESARRTARARHLIPGGAHTYARGEDQYPEDAPSFFVRGEGCRIWSADGAEFIEYSMGNRAVTLGYAYRPVVEAAYQQMKLGTGFVRPGAVELDLAEKLLSHFPGKDYMVKFGKHGSDAMSGAVKLARAFTGRDKIAICADQPFFSVDDWFIGTTVLNAGIPQATQDLTLKFPYGDLTRLEALFDAEPNIACVVMEPMTTKRPAPGYLAGVRKICDRNGALLIFDEVITGYRFGFPAIHPVLDGHPDLFALSKAMANGFAVSALVGKREVMHLGGMEHDRPRVFLLSTTFGGETHALAAAIKVMEIYESEDVISALDRQGARLKEGVLACAKAEGVDGFFQLEGMNSNLLYVTKDRNGEKSQAFRTLFMEQIIARGFIGPSFVIGTPHDDAIVDRTIEAVAGALKVYARALEDGVERHLMGRSVKTVYRRFASA
jgi:glutamate-1-semialdehyde 2,1-aminomutase